MLAWPLRLVTLFFFSICQAVANYSSTVRGAPTQDHSRITQILASEHEMNRDGTFQILADGSQDLTALIGLFATDGVERYAIDFTRGFLPPATAPLSLLGLLGYVRTLLKLSFGVELCERVGFSVASLRSFTGFRRSDFTPYNKVVNVYYLERSRQESSVQWRLVKIVPHTEDSMPLIAASGSREPRVLQTQDESFDVAMWRLPQKKGTRSLSFSLYSICLGIAVSFSSFPVLMFTPRWTWIRIFAFAGLPTSVLLGGLPWCLIYITEHIPFEPCDWFRSDWKGGTGQTTGSASEPGGSLSRKNSFAYFAKGDQFHIFDCQAVGNRSIWLTRIASFCSAICITIAYVCQYVELRSSTVKISRIWLGLQGLLAIVRIASWAWAPRVLGFSNDPETEWTDQHESLLKNSLTELEITLCWVSASQGCYTGPHLPKWLVEKIDSMKLKEAFATARRLHADTPRNRDLSLLKDVKSHWDMPDSIFAKWLQLRCRSHGHDVSYLASKRRMGIASWVCRIIQDSEGILHVIPGISVHVHSTNGANPPIEVVFLSRFRDREKNVFCFPSGGPNETQALYCGLGDMPDEHHGTGKRSLEEWYQKVVDELWDEMLLALGVLGLVEIQHSPTLVSG